MPRVSPGLSGRCKGKIGESGRDLSRNEFEKEGDFKMNALLILAVALMITVFVTRNLLLLKPQKEKSNRI
jgi:hypothetical protein